jgi:PAS domain S-box-containing protein
VSRDITEQKQAQEALRESEEKYRTILESIEDGYYEVDIAGNFTFFNDSMCRILGYPKDELMGMNNREYSDKEAAKKVYQVFNKVYSTGKPAKGSGWEILRKDGTKRHIETSVSLIKDSEGHGIGFRGIVRDVTVRKRAEEEIRKLSSAVDQSIDGIAI